MTIKSWPYVYQSTSDVEFSKLFRELISDGVAGSVADNSLKVTGDSSGMQVKIAAGKGFVRGFFIESTAQEVRTIEASTTSPRIDSVILRLDLSKTFGERITIAVKKGTPAASPVAPALAQSETGVYEHLLANVAVSASAITIAPANVSDLRAFVNNRVLVGFLSQRPTSTRNGQLFYNMSDLKLQVFRNSAWEDVNKTPTWSDIAGKPTTSTLDGRTIRIGDSAPANSLGVDGDIYLEY